MNNQLRDIFFQLLRIGLWGEGKLSLTQPLSDDDWKSILKYASNHTVEGIIYDSFAILHEDQLPPIAIRLKWAVRVDQIERHNVKMNAVIAEQFTLFTQNGIRPILQKGQGVASYYRMPNHRISGDIDWCFEDDDYSKARSFLKEKKIKFRDTGGFSLDYDYKDIHIEHHKRTFDFLNPFIKKYLNKLLIEYKNQHKLININDFKITLLAYELQLLQINVHILKHSITYGIGFRQFCDSAQLYHRVSSKIDKKKLYQIYKTTGILKWIHLLHKLLVDYIGLPQTSLPFEYPRDTNIDWMINEVWYSGNFGFDDERFKNSEQSLLFHRPDSAKRLWRNFKRYVRYAPKETIALPIVYTYSKFLGKDSD
ncbi:nucleotidyltransferase domain-containing protein [Sphingobacterium sp. UBA5996]|uniref:nucleotidyltransferase domain-containing protein n=1 Tax=Sphingobacterium sp. UBA5996 TaxID=1947505 RepID=UPI0025D05616|nr:nucleotidyltransferase family protein [Sphingobacterium sp. UBA5996]